MEIIEMRNKNAVLILEKEYNNNLINAIFNEKDPSGNYHVQNMFYKGKNKLWFELVSSYKFQKYTHGAFNRLLTYDKSFVSEVEKISKEYKKVYVFISSSFFDGPSWEKTELKQIKRKCPNLKIILYYIDIIQSRYCRWANLYRERYPNLFDLIYTSDMADAKEYNLIYYPLPYAYNSDMIKFNDTKLKDLFFCANIKKRSGKILEILKACEENEIDVSMELFPNEENEKDLFSEYSDNVRIIKQFKKYSEMLPKTLGARCILDIVQDGQTALTMRPYEAVVYNKKLLTNNSSILEFKYYDPNYIQYFSDPHEINWDWVKEKTSVDYAYQGDFSPRYLWKDIESRL